MGPLVSGRLDPRPGRRRPPLATPTCPTPPLVAKRRLGPAYAGRPDRPQVAPRPADANAMQRLAVRQMSSVYLTLQPISLIFEKTSLLLQQYK